jgi:hypothetical protein
MQLLIIKAKARRNVSRPSVTFGFQRPHRYIFLAQFRSFVSDEA